MICFTFFNTRKMQKISHHNSILRASTVSPFYRWEYESQRELLLYSNSFTGNRVKAMVYSISNSYFPPLKCFQYPLSMTLMQCVCDVNTTYMFVSNNLIFKWFDVWCMYVFMQLICFVLNFYPTVQKTVTKTTLHLVHI